MAYVIRIRGVVQGVGFRPTVYRIATSMGLNGYVKNLGSSVEVVVDREPEQFMKQLEQYLPALARIDDYEIEETTLCMEGFTIVMSSDGERESTIPVDTAVCTECFKEFMTPGNRRYEYPFTNCVECGARFTLIDKLPYDREHTSMALFQMCEECYAEYSDPGNRRFHAQTISCPKCGPQYVLYDAEQNPVGGGIKAFAGFIDKGYLCVLKGWGGMHIAAVEESCNALRERFGRKQKPFAVMFRDIESVEKYCDLTRKEKEILLSSARPIVVVRKKKEMECISPGLPNIGVFLPYAVIHHLLFKYLLRDFIILTSANLPGEPIITDNREVFNLGTVSYTHLTLPTKA